MRTNNVDKTLGRLHRGVARRGFWIGPTVSCHHSSGGAGGGVGGLQDVDERKGLVTADHLGATNSRIRSFTTLNDQDSAGPCEQYSGSEGRIFHDDRLRLCDDPSEGLRPGGADFVAGLSISPEERIVRGVQAALWIAFVAGPRDGAMRGTKPDERPHRDCQPRSRHPPLARRSGPHLCQRAIAERSVGDAIGAEILHEASEKVAGERIATEGAFGSIVEKVSDLSVCHEQTHRLFCALPQWWSPARRRFARGSATLAPPAP